MAGGKTSPKKVVIAERESKAVGARKSGASYPAIAARLSQEYGEKYTAQRAFEDVNRALKRVAEETRHDAEELRTLELERYDQWLLSLATKIQRGEEKAIQTAIQISDRRCKLLGLDAPIQVKIQEGIENGLEIELTQFLDSLGMVLPHDTFVEVLNAVNTLQNRSQEAAGN